MRPHIAIIIPIVGLLPSSAADQLPLESIPVSCATICSPIVELTALCSRKRTMPDIQRIQRRARKLQPLYSDQAENSRKDVRPDTPRLDRRLFVTLIPAPATFPPSNPNSLPTKSTQSNPPAQAPSPAPPPPPPPPPPKQTTQAPPAPPPPPPPPPPPSTTAMSTFQNSPDEIAKTVESTQSQGRGPSSTTMRPLTTGSKNGQTSMSGMIDGNSGDSDTGPNKTSPEDDEEACVCGNHSFDVSKLTALCASCIDGKSKTRVDNNLKLIMDTCGFPDEFYSPDKDKLANGIVVKAATTGNSTTTSDTCRIIGSNDFLATWIPLFLTVLLF